MPTCIIPRHRLATWAGHQTKQARKHTNYFLCSGTACRLSLKAHHPLRRAQIQRFYRNNRALVFLGTVQLRQTAPRPFTRILCFVGSARDDHCSKALRIGGSTNTRRVSSTATKLAGKKDIIETYQHTCLGLRFLKTQPVTKRKHCVQSQDQSLRE